MKSEMAIRRELASLESLRYAPGVLQRYKGKRDALRWVLEEDEVQK